MFLSFRTFLSALTFLTFLSAMVSACSVYDPDLTENPFRPGGIDGGSAAEAGTRDSAIDDGPVLDTGVADAGEGQGEQDAVVDGGGEGEGGAQGCIPNPDDDGSCPQICPEICDGADNDCDGETDEEEADESCQVANAVSVCVKGACVIVQCDAGYDSCDGDAENGCETALDTLSDCGACGEVCSGTSCAGGVCTSLECEQGFADCDGDPDNGCEASLDTLIDCAMCGNGCGYDNAYASCESGACELVRCEPGYGDCDQDPSNGCEVRLDTLSDCGECGQQCDGESCAGGVCTSLECETGFADCDGDEDNGCETPLDTLDDCAMCGRSCVFPQMITACDDGQCEFIQCRAGFDDCDGDQANGCETRLDTLTNCGACGVRCVVPNGDPSCAGGICTAANCGEGFADCDGDIDNGCETSLRTLDDCGMCDSACGPLDNATATCASGSCEIKSCSADWDDCDGQALTGCETSLLTNDDCGGCGQTCSLAHATASCATGKCLVTGCDGGWGDCTADPGCETRLNTVDNCADCGDACPDLPHAAEVCSDGICGMGACDTDWGDCTTDAGCETSLTTATNCGGCANQDPSHDCTLLPHVVNPSCDAGDCVFEDCAGSYEDCSAEPGCETLLGTDTACSECGDDCTARQNVNQVDCVASTCVIVSCLGDTRDCDSDDDQTRTGCETQLGTVSDCADCGDACPDPPHAYAGCNDHVCGIGQCHDNWGDCNAEAGCETQLGTPTNCSGCGDNCQALPDVAAATCESGTCNITGCSGTHWNCDGVPGNGCEIDLAIDANNCGSCGYVCTDLPHVQTASCAASTCVITSCSGDWFDCDGLVGNGCEINLATDANNCGTCGYVCTGLPDVTAASCVSLQCVITGCAGDTSDCDKVPDNGCEKDLGTDADNCGACGYVCTDLPDVTAADCVARECDITGCLGTSEDCDGDPDNGCEIDLATDVNNCNSCDYVCPDLPYAGEVCLGGVCGLGACDDNYDNCDGLPGNGCEADLLNEVDNCGGCGTVCTDLDNVSTAFCQSGDCVITGCEGTHSNCDGQVANGCEFDLTDMTAFGYTPSNFDPAGLSSNACPVTLNCGTSTFNSQTLTYSNWCGQAEPVPVVRTQSSGPDVVIIPLSGLTVASGSTLRLQGDRPVILAVFGDVSIAGTVDASGSGTTPGAGGNWSCGSSKGGDSTNNDCTSGSSGAGGGGFGTAGGRGGSGGGGNRGSGGVARGNTDIVPLYGGCLGGQVFHGDGSDPVGGGGGGAVQISAAGTLTVSGAVRANGGVGAEGSCGNEAGGAGGGSGGAILLEGTAVSTSGATITANGGDGGDGEEGHRAGGDGSTSPSNDGDDGSGSSADGAGGGGGGYGRVAIKTYP
jgi:hypothetical protein